MPKIAHIANFSQDNAGMPRTAYEIAMAGNSAIAGAEITLIDTAAHDSKSWLLARRGFEVVTNFVGNYDVVCCHHKLPPPECKYRILVVFLHGMPEHVVEDYGNTGIIEELRQLPPSTIFVTLWAQHSQGWNALLSRDVEVLPLMLGTGSGGVPDWAGASYMTTLAPLLPEPASLFLPAEPKEYIVVADTWRGGTGAFTGITKAIALAKLGADVAVVASCGVNQGLPKQLHGMLIRYNADVATGYNDDKRVKAKPIAIYDFMPAAEFVALLQSAAMLVTGNGIATRCVREALALGVRVLVAKPDGDNHILVPSSIINHSELAGIFNNNVELRKILSQTRRYVVASADTDVVSPSLKFGNGWRRLLVEAGINSVSIGKRCAVVIPSINLELADHVCGQLESFVNTESHTVVVATGTGNSQAWNDGSYGMGYRHAEAIPVPSRSKAGPGFSENVNAGLRHVLSGMMLDKDSYNNDSKVIVIMNDDVTFLEPPATTLLRMYHALKDNGWAAVSALTCNANNNSGAADISLIVPESGVGQATANTGPGDDKLHKALAIHRQGYGKDSVGSDSRIPFTLVMIRVSTLLKVGLLDEWTLPDYGSDNDYCARMRQHGYKFGLALGAVVWHEGGASYGNNEDVIGDAKTRLKRKWGLVT